MVEALKNRYIIQKLALRMRRGDSNAADKLYRMLVAQTFGFYFSRVRDRAHAEDLTQEAFMKLARSISQYDESRGDFVVWYWRMARNMLIDHFRTNKESRVSDIDSVPEHAVAPSDEDLAERIDEKERKSFLSACITKLGNEERDLFEMRFVSELSYKEIADMTGKKEGALRVAVNRLKQKIERMMLERTAGNGTYGTEKTI